MKDIEGQIIKRGNFLIDKYEWIYIVIHVFDDYITGAPGFGPLEKLRRIDDANYGWDQRAIHNEKIRIYPKTGPRTTALPSITFNKNGTTTN